MSSPRKERHPRAGGDLRVFSLNLIKHNQLLRSRSEIPDNAPHFRDDGALIWVFDTVIPARNVIPAQAGISERFRDDGAFILRF